MKKINMILMAFALALTMSQCKKNEGQITSNDEVVTITLDVKQNNGSKVVVNPNTGTVDFETGDKIYVGSGGKYVGFLTHNGTNFSGNITNPTENQPLQFYFLGNVTPQETLSAGTTEECSVIISDQTEHLPVISCAASNENYVSGVTAYSAHLLNKCALVKFNVTTPSNSPICITGMKNKVTVDFTQNTMIPSQDGDGVIMLPAGSGENVEKWAILLPQEALEVGEEGTAYSEDGSYTGIRPTISMISENDYMANGITVMVNTVPVVGIPEGAINGLFTINSNGDQVYFSQGNLQYQAFTNTWRFAENQWDYVGDGNANISSTYDGWIDLFSWGTGNDPTYVGVNQSFNEWGDNPIVNGGNQEGEWRTLSVGYWNGSILWEEEWPYLLNSRTTMSGIRYAKAQVNSVNGIIIVPDNWDSSVYNLNNSNTVSAPFISNIISEDEWENFFEETGCVFLPAGGRRSDSSVYEAGEVGWYWSSSGRSSNPGWYIPGQVDYNAFNIDFSNSGLYASDYFNKSCGYSVRLVKNYNP